MIQPKIVYDNQLKKYSLELKQLNKTLVNLSIARVVLFLGFAFAIYLFFTTWQIAVAIAVVGVLSFLGLLSKYTNIKANRDFKKALVQINKDEIKIASGDFYDRSEGLEFQNPKHDYSLDIDLFGRGSFFQFMNRTVISEGRQVLVDSLTSNSITNITQKQEAVKELKEQMQWRQEFCAIASLASPETSAKISIRWLKGYKLFLPKIMRWIPTVFRSVSVLLITLSSLGYVNFSVTIFWFVIGLIITGLYVKKVNNLATNTNTLKNTFKQYAMLLDKIEAKPFASQMLKAQQLKIKSDTKKASAIFKDLSKALAALDNRNNLFVIFFGNGFFLTDIKNSYRVESWIAQHKNKVSDWFDVISFFDAYNTLGNYAFNHPKFVFPEIKTQGAIISARELGHPLLDSAKRVDSDVLINNEQFFIVTGANMAGKSTFLRSISLHIVMANAGLPVCANSSQYRPVKLITSMRSSDSLADDSSYFFSELTRLKFIVDTIKQGPHFIILDEILKGTNSTDKAIGSRKFVEKLVASRATGIIATHDLSLCEITKSLTNVKNYYFDATINDDELQFDYTLKQGICQNMNASFLLKKMQIV